MDRAITSAYETFKQVKFSPFERYEILNRAAEGVRRRRDELALLLIKEAGKVRKDAYAEIERGIQNADRLSRRG